MEKAFLSQAEIDGLPGTSNGRVNLSEQERDILGEIGNINASSSSTALSEILKQRVLLDAPAISFTNLNELHQRFETPYILIEIEYTSGIPGKNLFILKSEDAVVISDIMMGGNGQDVTCKIDELTLSAVSEAMNQMIGTSATSMSEIFDKTISISPPRVRLINVKEEAAQIEPDKKEVVVISFKLKIGDLMENQTMLVMNLDAAKEYVRYLVGGTADGLAG
jgi:flagellar motor switch protein FliN/FliY